VCVGSTRHILKEHNTVPASLTPTVCISGKTFPYQRPWDGQRLELRPACPYVAFDTETEVVDLTRAVPRLALAAVSTGGQHALLHPDQLGDFLLRHHDARYVFFNVAFDFWVVDRHLRSREEEKARRLWWDACHEGRMHCAMLLDVLVRLAEGRLEKAKGSGKEWIPPRNLADVAAEYTALRVAKDDPFRTRYGEILGRDWTQVEEGFFAYAIKDPVVTLRAYLNLTDVAQRIMREHGYDPTLTVNDRHVIRPDAVRQYGLLSEHVQVKAAVALAEVTRAGMHLDARRVEELHASYRRRLQEVIDGFLRDYPGVFKLDCEGNVLRSQKTQTPSVNENLLRELLVQAAGQMEKEQGDPIKVPKTPTGKVSTSARAWAAHAGRQPLIRLWVEKEKVAKLCEFFGGLQQGVVHPRYNVLLRTGRTSCERPNVQQVPRDGGFRELFVPSPGHLLLAIDYTFIELRTLAAVCEARFGSSRLADTIRAGTDPHCYTAALLLNLTPEEFMALADAVDEVEIDGVTQRRKGYWFKKHRQHAKPVNFGVPGGLGAPSLVDYARNNYKVALTPEEAREKRGRLINEVYPELNERDGYLADDGVATLARNLKAQSDGCWEAIDRTGTKDPSVVRAVQKIVRGEATRADGTPYSPGFVWRTWEALNKLNRNGDPRLVELLEGRHGGKELHGILFGQGVVTLTGRVRGKVGYTQAKNTPFQSLAADGAKLALWELLYHGFRVVGFVHDELLVELPDQGGYVEQAVCERVKRVVCEAMARVTVSVPVDAEYTLSRCWSKEAKLLVRDGRVYPWQPDH
jgi:hypothetical protein